MRRRHNQALRDMIVELDDEIDNTAAYDHEKSTRGNEQA